MGKERERKKEKKWVHIQTADDSIILNDEREKKKLDRSGFQKWLYLLNILEEMDKNT